MSFDRFPQMKQLSSNKFQPLVKGMGAFLITIFLLYFFLAVKAQSWDMDIIYWKLKNFFVEAHYRYLASEPSVDCFDKLNTVYAKVRPEEFIHILSTEDVPRMRKQLYEYLWKKDSLPDRFPDKIDIDIDKQDYIYTSGLKNLSHIDHYQVKMDLGFTSEIYHFHPKRSVNHVFVFHKGHGSLKSEESVVPIASLLENGFSVVVLQMPLLSPNTGPARNHDRMKQLETKDLNPMKFFVEPVIVTLNYLEENYDYDHTDMIGISGGGWTTTLAAALDTRIEYSFPVAGSYPLYLRKPPCTSFHERGDYESREISLYRDVMSYLDLYILGSIGSNRSQIQILNRYDGIFNGIRYQTYEDIVQKRVQSIGSGSFSVYSDISHNEHKISLTALSEAVYASRKGLADSY